MRELIKTSKLVLGPFNFQVYAAEENGLIHVVSCGLGHCEIML